MTPATDETRGPATTPAPDALDKFFHWLRGLGVQRRTDNKWVGGVASGLADRLRVDPLIVRAAFVLSLALGGLTAYLVAWVLLPDRQGRIAAERAIRHGHGGSIVLLVFAAISVFSSGFPWWADGGHFGWSFPWGLLIIGGIVWWMVRQSRDRQQPDQHTPWGAQATASQSTAAEQATAADPHASSPETGSVAPASWTTSSQSHEPAGWAPPSGSAQPSPWPQPSGSAQPSPWPQPSGSAQPSPWPQPSGWAPPPAPTAPVPPAPAQPPAPRRKSGGLLMTLVAVGLALVTYGATLWTTDRLGVSGDHHFLAFCGALGALGLLILGLGAAGWRAGFVGFLAICTAVAAFLAGVFPAGVDFGGRVGDQTWRPTSISSNQTFRMAAGEGRLDLADLPTEGLTGERVAVSVGMGDLTIAVPDNLTVEVNGHVGLGDIQAPGDGLGRNDYSGTDVTHRVVVGDGPTELVVDANVGIGQITVVKE